MLGRYPTTELQPQPCFLLPWFYHLVYSHPVIGKNSQVQCHFWLCFILPEECQLYKLNYRIDPHGTSIPTVWAQIIFLPLFAFTKIYVSTYYASQGMNREISTWEGFFKVETLLLCSLANSSSLLHKNKNPMEFNFSHSNFSTPSLAR